MKQKSKNSQLVASMQSTHGNSLYQIRQAFIRSFLRSIQTSFNTWLVLTSNTYIRVLILALPIAMLEMLSNSLHSNSI